MTAAILADLIAIALAAPLLASVVTNVWSWFWTPGTVGPLPAGTHKWLVAGEALCAFLLVMPVGAALRFSLAAGMYALLGGGGAVLLRRLGPVPCGCWGATGHTLSWRLVSANALWALLALTQIGAPSTLTAQSGFLILLALVTLSLVFGIALPDMRHAMVGVRQRADNERRWFNRFPDLEDA